MRISMQQAWQKLSLAPSYINFVVFETAFGHFISETANAFFKIRSYSCVQYGFANGGILNNLKFYNTLLLYKRQTQGIHQFIHKSCLIKSIP